MSTNAQTPSPMQAMVMKARVGDLSNPIHAIFRKANFRNVSDDEYDALAPALRLATRLLTTKELAGFPHALLVAPYGRWQDQEDPTHQEWWFQKKLPTLTVQDMAEYETALSALADMVVFNMVDTEPHGCGYCRWDQNSTPPQGTHLQSCSSIDLSRSDVFWAVGNRDTASESANQKHSIMVAKIFCHELMHAMASARLGELYPVPFNMPFGWQTVVETGYEWEQYVFGGLIATTRPEYIPEQTPNDYETVNLRIVAWPCASLTRSYVKENYPIFITQEPPSIEVHWLIDPSQFGTWVPSLFSTHFWEHVVPQKGADVVKPLKLSGIRHEVDADGKATEPADPFALPANTIPAGYEEDPVDGEVVIIIP
jgi:hypothetical protein